MRSVRSVCNKIFVLFDLFVFKKIRVLSVLISVCNKIFVLFGLLLPFGQWAYGESRVQKILV